VLPAAQTGFADPGFNEDIVKEYISAEELAPLLDRNRKGYFVNLHVSSSVEATACVS
jgi:hypothetical protein